MCRTHWPVGMTSTKGLCLPWGARRLAKSQFWPLLGRAMGATLARICAHRRFWGREQLLHMFQPLGVQTVRGNSYRDMSCCALAPPRVSDKCVHSLFDVSSRLRIGSRWWPCWPWSAPMIFLDVVQGGDSAGVVPAPVAHSVQQGRESHGQSRVRHGDRPSRWRQGQRAATCAASATLVMHSDGEYACANVGPPPILVTVAECCDSYRGVGSPRLV